MHNKVGRPNTNDSVCNAHGRELPYLAQKTRSAIFLPKELTCALSRSQGPSYPLHLLQNWRVVQLSTCGNIFARTTRTNVRHCWWATLEALHHSCEDIGFWFCHLAKTCRNCIGYRSWDTSLHLWLCSDILQYDVSLEYNRKSNIEFESHLNKYWWWYLVSRVNKLYATFSRPASVRDTQTCAITGPSMVDIKQKLLSVMSDQGWYGRVV